MNLSTGGFRLWPFGRKSEPTKRQLNSLPSGPQTLTAMPPVKQQALLYLDATLAVLQREGIPLARPVHGKPARGARFIEIPINLDRRRCAKSSTAAPSAPSRPRPRWTALVKLPISIARRPSLRTPSVRFGSTMTKPISP